MPTFSSYETYQYCDAMVKHLPEKSLKKPKKLFFYSYNTVAFNKRTIDRRTHSSNTAADITDNNLKGRIDKFQYQIKNKCIYRIPIIFSNWKNPR